MYHLLRHPDSGLFVLCFFGRDPPPAGLEALCVELGRAGQLISYGQPFYLDGRRWFTARACAVPAWLHRQAIFMLAPDAAGVTEFAARWIAAAGANAAAPAGSARQDPYAVAAVLSGQGYRVARALPRGAYELFGAPGALVPVCSGAYAHPVEGRLEGNWMCQFHAPLPPPSADFAALRALFSCFGLDPASHAVLYSWLLAALSAESFGQPRPFLVVDSWEQGRGKSEVCNALAILLQGAPGGLSYGSREAFRDNAVAALNTGARLIVLHNIDTGMHEWQDEILCQLATDGGYQARVKYAAETKLFSGILVAANFVYGMACLSRDMLSRTWRCELRGRAQPLSPRPEPFAHEHRLQILADGLEACRRGRAGPDPPVADSRFSAFTRRGLAAYAAVFGGAPGAALEAAHRGREALSQSCLAALYTAHAERFVDGSAPAGGFVVKKMKGVDGATALGYTFANGKWETQ